MVTRRSARVAQAIKEVVSSTILLGLRDPRIKNVTVTRTEVTEDTREAKIYVSVMGGSKSEALSLKGLQSARGFLQSKIAEQLQTKNTPILSFVIDNGPKVVAGTSRALREIEQEDSSLLDQETDEEIEEEIELEHEPVAGNPESEATPFERENDESNNS